MEDLLMNFDNKNLRTVYFRDTLIQDHLANV